ncbi:MAG: hypothetical protein ABWX96_09675 [Propionibacteriaceae bacterium]
MTKNNSVKRALRFFDRFTLFTMNGSSPYNSPYTGQISRVMSGPRVF